MECLLISTKLFFAANNAWTNLYIFVSALLIPGFLWVIFKQIQHKKRLQTHMDALQAQINPHFISNSLNAIESLINQDKKEAAAKYLIHFSRFTRYILAGSREATVTLHEELEILRHFLALEQLRFRDKLSFEIWLEEGIYPKLVPVPNMMIQPYVENAIWYGIKPKGGPGHLSIRVSKEENFLLCTIEDNGIGRKKSKALQADAIPIRDSYGLSYTEKRLPKLSGQRYPQVEIIDLNTPGGDPSGTRVLFRIPLYPSKKQKLYESFTSHFGRR